MKIRRATIPKTREDKNDGETGALDLKQLQRHLKQLQRHLERWAREDRRRKRKELARLVKKDRTTNADAAHELQLKQPPESAANGGGGAADSDDDLPEEFFM